MLLELYLTLRSVKHIPDSHSIVKRKTELLHEVRMAPKRFSTQADCVQDQLNKVTGGASRSAFWQPSWLMQIVPQRFFDLHFGEPAARATQTTLLEYPHGAMPPILRGNVSETVWLWSRAGRP